MNTDTDYYSKKLQDFFYGILNMPDAANIFQSLSKYERGYEIDKVKIREAIETAKKQHNCCNRYYDLMIELFDSVRYIGAKEAEETFSKNIKDIEKYHREYRFTLVMVVPRDSKLNHSNMFYILYTLYHLKTLGIEIENFILSDFNYDTSSTNYLVIFTDDFSYSGGQLLVETIQPTFRPDAEFVIPDYAIHFPNSNAVPTKKTDVPNVMIYLNIIGWTKKAENRITNYFLGKNIVDNVGNFAKIDERSLSVRHFLKYFYDKKKNEKDVILDGVEFTDSLNFTTLYDCFKVKKEKPIQLTSMLLPMLLPMLEKKELTLIYLFSKYPDGASTYSKLCVLDLNMSERVLDVEKLIDSSPNVKQTFMDNAHNRLWLGNPQINLEDFLQTCTITQNPTNTFNEGVIKTFPFTNSIMNRDGHADCSLSIKPFYKQIEYKNELNGPILDMNTNILDLLDSLNKEDSNKNSRLANQFSSPTKKTRIRGGRPTRIKHKKNKRYTIKYRKHRKHKTYNKK